MTLQLITRRPGGGYVENSNNKRTWKIRTTLKCKRKKKSNGQRDKHKARAAARGDTLRRAMTKANVPLPNSYSPTIMPLSNLRTFPATRRHPATLHGNNGYQVSILERSTSFGSQLDRKHPGDANRLCTRSQPCARIPHRKRTICYTMSAFDNCLFYRIAATETTYIIVYVDDTFIFSNSLVNII
jgi:hypothetical protein